MHMFRFTTCCMYLFQDFVIFSTCVSPLGLHVWPKIAISLIHVFQLLFDQNIQIKMESCGGHMWHISGKGGTGRHLGHIWGHLGGWRLKRHLEARSHIMCLTLERNAKVPLKCQFVRGLFDGTINSDCIFTVRYERWLCGGSRRPVKGPLPTPWEPH